MRVPADALRAAELPPVAIVGAGMAGIALARALAARGIPSLLLEAGHEAMTAASQAHFAGLTDGPPIGALDEVRVRAFGGTSAVWTGHCRAFDAEDLAGRPELGMPAWPIGISDLAPYRAAAFALFGAAPPRDRPAGPDLVEVDFGPARAVRFAEAFGAEIDRSPLVRLALDCPVTALHASGGRIAGIEIRPGSGAPVRIAPAITVLAAGGIETLRLLLWSAETSPEPPVAPEAPLGRYWMEHPYRTVGIARLTREARARLDRAPGAARWFAPSEAARRRHGILGAQIRMTSPAVHRSATRAAALVRRAALRAPTLAAPIFRALGRRLEHRVRVRIGWEIGPDAENRVALDGGARCPLGIPRPLVRWRLSERDRRTPDVVTALLEAHLAAAGEGRILRWGPDLAEACPPSSGAHHMGGARMGGSPREGVVDRDLRIFGAANAYVLGSAAFPTGGYANPSVTVIELALRLADHLAARLEAEGAGAGLLASGRDARPVP